MRAAKPCFVTGSGSLSLSTVAACGLTLGGDTGHASCCEPAQPPQDSNLTFQCPYPGCDFEPGGRERAPPARTSCVSSPSPVRTACVQQGCSTLSSRTVYSSSASPSMGVVSGDVCADSSCGEVSARLRSPQVSQKFTYQSLGSRSLYSKDDKSNVEVKYELFPGVRMQVKQTSGDSRPHVDIDPIRTDSLGAQIESKIDSKFSAEDYTAIPLRHAESFIRSDPTPQTTRQPPVAVPSSATATADPIDEIEITTKNALDVPRDGGPRGKDEGITEPTATTEYSYSADFGDDFASEEECCYGDEGPEPDADAVSNRIDFPRPGPPTSGEGQSKSNQPPAFAGGDWTAKTEFNSSKYHATVSASV